MNRKIPVKNYLICSLIFIVIITTSLILYFIYDNHKVLESKIPVLRGRVQEITIDSVDEYLKENDGVLLYVGVANDPNSRELEEELIPLLDKNIISIIYLNITDIDNKNAFFKDFNEEYSNGTNLNNYPALVYISDNKISSLVQKENGILTYSTVKSFLNSIHGGKND